MANLHSLTNAQVARYHREAYRPDNMLFILSGTAKEADFLAALEQARARARVCVCVCVVEAKSTLARAARGAPYLLWRHLLYRWRRASSPRASSGGGCPGRGAAPWRP